MPALAVALALATSLGIPFDAGRRPDSPPARPVQPAVAARPSPSAPWGDTVPAEPAPPTSAEPEALRGYVWPLRTARITTWFAPTDGGFVMIDRQRVHDGIDLATFCGDYVTAAHDGTVVYAGRRFDPYVGFSEPPDAFYALLAKRGASIARLPIVVVIDDGNGYHSLYVHLRQALVKRGQVVRAGDRIGREGMTGHASGCHLHYGLVRMDGDYVAVAPQLVKKWRYPAFVRERIDPMRVLSLSQPGAGRMVPGIPPPRVSPGHGPLILDRPGVAPSASRPTRD